MQCGPSSPASSLSPFRILPHYPLSSSPSSSRRVITEQVLAKKKKGTTDTSTKADALPSDESISKKSADKKAPEVSVTIDSPTRATVAGSSTDRPIATPDPALNA